MATNIAQMRHVRPEFAHRLLIVGETYVTVNNFEDADLDLAGLKLLLCCGINKLNQIVFTNAIESTLERRVVEMITQLTRSNDDMHFEDATLKQMINVMRSSRQRQRALHWHYSRVLNSIMHADPSDKIINISMLAAGMGPADEVPEHVQNLIMNLMEQKSQNRRLHCCS